MKHRIKQISAVLAAAVMLVACSEQSGVQTLDSPIAKPEYLSFFSSQKMGETDLSKYWIDRFTEKYNKQIYVNFDGATYYADEGLSYRELLERRLASSSPDDLYIISAEDVLEFEKKGYWMDLSDLDFVDNLSEAALYQSTHNGKVFSVPLGFTGFGLAWNVDMLERYGLTVPTNLSEFLHTCEVLKSNGILPYGANKGYALTTPAMCIGFSSLYGSPDQTDQIDALNSGETPVSNYLRDGFAFLSLMIEKGYMDPQQAINTNPREDADLFFEENCAFFCTTVGNFTEAENFRVEITGFPLLEDGYISVYGAQTRLCVNPNSRHLETALEFVELVGTTEALNEGAALVHLISSAKDGGANTFTSDKQLADQIRQPGQVPNQDFSLHFNTWESIRDVGREICSGASIDRACALLDEKQQADLAEYAAN